MNRSRPLASSCVGVLLTLAIYSIYLAANRIYQVDEFQALYMAKVQAMGQYKEFFTDSSLFLFGPLSWLTTSHLSSVGMITGARLIFLAVFWINLLLIARIAGGQLNSTRGLVALAGTATLAPLWDYGFEIRHDNLVLTGVLLIWWLARTRPAGILSYVIAGVVTVALLFTAVKALVYVVPLSFAIVAFPPPGLRSRWKAAAAWLAAAALTVGLIRLYYGNSGAWDNYFSTFRDVSKVTSGNAASGRFGPSDTLERLLSQAPLLVTVTVAALVAVGMDLWRLKKASLTWDGLLPEALLFLGAFGALIINPTPFNYNLVNLAPFAFIFGFRYAVEAAKAFDLSKQLWIPVATALIFLQFVPFSVLTYRHLFYDNERQQLLMNLAEQMTDPDKDLVYDGIGMVPTRRTADFHWYLHSLNTALIYTPGSRVRDFLAARPASVLIFSYRTDWLPKEDFDFIRSRYVPLADDISVLGTSLPAGGGTFQIFHPGRYCILPLPSQPDQSSTTNAPDAGTNAVTGTLDGKLLPTGPVQLEIGTHKLETSQNQKLAVVWVGPTLQGVLLLPSGNHRALFVNWY